MFNKQNGNSIEWRLLAIKFKPQYVMSKHLMRLRANCPWHRQS